MIICWSLLCRIRIYCSRYFCSFHWVTVDVVPPNVSDLVLLLLYCCCTHHPTDLIMCLSYTVLIIPHIFLCPDNLASLSHLCCCCINIPTYPPEYHLIYLLISTFIFHIWFYCPCQNHSTLNFSSDVFCISLNFCLCSLWYTVYLPHIYCCCLHHPTSIPLTSSLYHVSIADLIINCHLLFTCDHVTLPLTYMASLVYDYAVFVLPFLLFRHIHCPTPLTLTTSLSQLFYTIAIIPHLLHHHNHIQLPTCVSVITITLLNLFYCYHHTPLSSHISTATEVILLLCFWSFCNFAQSSSLTSSTNTIVPLPT